ncbi:MAG TPA: hypothetical protein VGB52_07320 [Actinomycetota bacterium]
MCEQHARARLLERLADLLEQLQGSFQIGARGLYLAPRCRDPSGSARGFGLDPRMRRRARERVQPFGDGPR